MATFTKHIASCLLIIALITIPLAGCTGNLPPTADFTYSPPTPTTNDSILFIDSSTDDDGSIVTWAWDFGDGNTSVAQNPSHSFQNPGTYTVSLTVTDNGGASDTHTAIISVSTAPDIGKDDAIELLVSEIIKPAYSNKGISAFMLSQPLQAGDTVTSESGEDYPIDANTWFIFIDDAPQAFFAHDTRYVFIDAKTAAYNIINESWPPRINNISMWNPQNLGSGHLIEVYSILDNPVPISGSTSQAPSGDYGDAPDGQDAYYGVPGRFPTLFNTTNSHFARPGGHTLNIGEETLGLKVSAEVDANDPNDPDGVPNLVDADSDERMFVILDSGKAKLAFTVKVSPNAPDITRYANVLIDFDQSGNWSTGTYGIEWVVVNLEVDVAPGSDDTIITPEFSWGNQTVLPSPVWMRVSLTRAKVDETLFANVGGWDGSGRFEYGEIEDHLTFLMDNPPLPEFAPRWPPTPGKPPGGNGKPPPGGGGQPPGPPKGPCGYDINFYVITISGGDSHDDLAKGTPIVQPSVDSMADVAGEQGYTSMGNLGPGNNSLGDIGSAFGQLAASVKCGDHVLIYICGHGKESGGIALKNSSGNTQEVLNPTNGDGEDNSLEDFLNKIPPCPDEDCETPGCCCHISVIIESCFAGNFNVDGVTGEGRSVVGTSTDTESWATYSGGGVYTEGLDEDLRDPDSDTSIPPDGVDPMEANESAKAKVNEHNRKQGKAQEPWEDNQWCECKCPCKPGIDVDKWVWYDPFDTWSDEIEAEPGQPVTFRLEIENDGECRDIVDLGMIDFLPGCLEYGNEAVIYYNGTPYGSRPPDDINQSGGGLLLIWDLSDIGALAPGETIAIEYDAIAEYPGPNINEVFVSAHCAYDYSVIVYDQDAATVFVIPEEPPVEEVLYASFEAYAECTRDQWGCYCDVTIFFWAEDISTGGDYPVTSVILYINGVPFDSGPIYTGYYENFIGMEAGCGETIEIEIRAMNLVGMEVVGTDFFTTPIPPPL
jgi:PKD repeat protein